MKSPQEQVHTLTATTDQLQAEVDTLKQAVFTVIIVQIILTMIILRKL